MTEIEVLYFAGCPSWRRTWDQLGSVLAETGIDARVRLRDITELPEQQLSGFGGSPTVRIDGSDLEGYDGPPVMACRRYPDNDGLGWPTETQLRDALQRAETAELEA